MAVEEPVTSSGDLDLAELLLITGALDGPREALAGTTKADGCGVTARRRRRRLPLASSGQTGHQLDEKRAAGCARRSCARPTR